MSPWFFLPCLASSVGLFTVTRNVHRKHTGRNTSLKDHGITVQQISKYQAKLSHNLGLTLTQESPSPKALHILAPWRHSTS